ncbi:D-psicose 3-epimerase [subsurface metagenome]
MNRLAICNEIFENLDFSQLCKRMSEIGYDGIEIAPFTIAKDVRTFPTDRRHEMKKIAQSHGLEIIALHWLLVSPLGLHISSPDRQIYKHTLNYFKELITFGHDLGTKVLVLGSPAQRNIDSAWDKESAMVQIVEFLREVGDTAEVNDIMIGFEPLGPQITNVGGTTQDTLNLLTEVNHPNIKFHLDFSAMCRDPLPIDAQIDLVDIDRLVHVHVNDPNQYGPGMGDLEIGPILHQLHDKGYKGWYSVETFAKGISPLQIASESITNLKKYISD